MLDKKFIKQILILITIVIVLLLALFVFPNDKVVVKIDDIKILVELANTQEKRVQGLSNREKLEENAGLLFIFDRLDLHGIWMKDMNFAIDILWIDEDLKIIDIKQDAKVESYPEVFLPKEIAKYVLEVNAGFVNMNNIKIEDEIIF